MEIEEKDLLKDQDKEVSLEELQDQEKKEEELDENNTSETPNKL